MENIENIKKEVEKFDKEAFDYEAACREHKIMQEDIDTLRAMAKPSNYIPKAMFDRIFLLVLVACDSDKDKSLALLQNYCKLKNKFTQFFANRNINNANIQHSLNCQIFVTLPSTPDDCNLILHKISSYNSKNYVFDVAIKTFFMTIGKSYWK